MRKGVDTWGKREKEEEKGEENMYMCVCTPERWLKVVLRRAGRAVQERKRENTRCLPAHTLPLREDEDTSRLLPDTSVRIQHLLPPEFGTFTRGLLWLGRGFLTVWWKARDELALWSNILIPRMELSRGSLDLLPKLLRASQLVSRLRRDVEYLGFYSSRSYFKVT